MKQLVITFEQGTGRELYRQEIDVPDQEPTDLEKLEARVKELESAKLSN